MTASSDISILEASYSRVFSMILLPENATRFTAKEIAAAINIRKHAQYAFSDYFATQLDIASVLNQAENAVFTFTAAPGDFEKYKHSLDFIAAHEIKHAINFSADFSGRCFFRLVQKHYRLKQAIPDAPPFSKMFLHGLATIYEVIYVQLGRFQEYQADAFALRVFPKTDLGTLRQTLMLRDSRLQPVSGWGRLFDWFRNDHPTAAQRCRRLQRHQKKIFRANLQLCDKFP